MLKLTLLLLAAFWGDTQVDYWAFIDATYGVGLPVCNRLELVEFGLGYWNIGIGSAIAESYGFGTGETAEFIGSMLPLQVTVPIYQKVEFWKGDAFFSRWAAFRVRGSPWGQRYQAMGPLSFLVGSSWQAEAPYLAFEVSGKWSPVRMVGVTAVLGALVVKDAPERLYVTLGISVGTEGPVLAQGAGPRLSIRSAVFDDSVQGNSNGVLDPGEQARLLVLVENTGLTDSDSLIIKGLMRDPRLSEYLAIEEIRTEPVPRDSFKEITIPLKAAQRLPASPLRVRVWGRDDAGNLASPLNLEIPTQGS